MKWANTIRVILGVMYLAGGCVHVIFGLSSPQQYLGFSETALLPLYRDLFASVVAYRPALFAFIVAAVEFALALLILNGGRTVKPGLAASLVFQVLLVPLGVWGVFNIALALVHVPVLDAKTTYERVLFAA